MFRTFMSYLYKTGTTGTSLVKPLIRGPLPVVAVLAALLCTWPAAAAEKPSPAKIYNDHCSVCHGDNGDGQSHARQGLEPPPRDFTSPNVRASLTRRTMIEAITDGRDRTAMVSWRTRLDAVQIAAVVDYIRERFMQQGKTTVVHDRGQQIYAGSCSVCHGEDGRRAQWAGTSLDPPPRNFTSADAKANLSHKEMIDAVTYGRDRTAMVSFTRQLSPDDIEAVISYIRRAFMGKVDEPETVAMATGRGDDHASHDHSQHDHTGKSHGGAGEAMQPMDSDNASHDQSKHDHATHHAGEAHSDHKKHDDHASHGEAAQSADSDHAGHDHSTHDHADDDQIKHADPAIHMASAPRIDTDPGQDSAGKQGEHDHSSHISVSPELMAMNALPYDLVGDQHRGRDLFQQNCTACHGEKGDGEGPRAYFIFPKPANFRADSNRASLNRPQLFESIGKGVVGREMPAWRTVLENQQIADVAEYVYQTFILGQAPADGG